MWKTYMSFCRQSFDGCGLWYVGGRSRRSTRTSTGIRSTVILLFSLGASTSGQFIYLQLYFHLVFTARPHCLQCRALYYLQQFRLSVRPFVRLSHAGTLSRRMNIGSRGLHCEVPKHSSFLIPRMVGGDDPFHLKFALKVTHALWNAPTSTNICL